MEAVRREMEAAERMYQSNPNPTPASSKRYYYDDPAALHKKQMQQYEAQLQSLEAESLLKPDERRRLLGGLKSDTKQQIEQMSLIAELKSLPDPNSDVKIPHVENRRAEILQDLKKIRADQNRALGNELRTIAAPRKAHLKELNGTGGGSSTHGHDQQNPVIEMFNWMGNDEARQRMFRGKNNHAIDYKKNIQNLQAMPAVASVVGDIVDRKLSNKEQPDTAWDKIISLQTYVGRHHNPEHAQVAADVQNIFKQHAKDLGLTYHLSGKSYEETTNAIADAIVEQKLHPQALANILDDKKIVIFGKDDADFGDLKDVKQQLESLVARYSKADDKDIFKEISKQELKKFYHDMPQDEKPFFTMLFPPGVLEKAGVPHDEVARNREEGMQNFVEDLADKVRLLIGAGHDEIRKQGVKGKYIAPIEALESGFRRADRDGEASDFIRDNLKDVTKAVRNIETSAKKPGEMWKDFVARSQTQQEEQTAKTPMDHASREAGDEMHIGG